MPWAMLLVAGLAEIAWVIGLKYTEGFTKFWPSVWTGLGMAVSFLLLSQAIRTIPVGTGYAVWTGIGAAGAAILGIFLFDESREPARLLCLALIIGGVVGLKLLPGADEAAPVPESAAPVSSESSSQPAKGVENGASTNQ